MRQAESGQRRASLAGFKLVSYANVEDLSPSSQSHLSLYYTRQMRAERNRRHVQWPFYLRRDCRQQCTPHVFVGRSVLTLGGVAERLFVRSSGRLCSGKGLVINLRSGLGR